MSFVCFCRLVVCFCLFVGLLLFVVVVCLLCCVLLLFVVAVLRKGITAQNLP